MNRGNLILCFRRGLFSFCLLLLLRPATVSPGHEGSLLWRYTYCSLWPRSLRERSMRWPVGWADNVPIAGASRTAGYCRRYQRGSPTLRLPYCRVAYPGRIGRSTSSVGVVASHSQRTRWPARGVTTELVRRPQLRRLGAVAGAGSHSAYLSAPSTGFAEQQQRRPLPAPLATGAVAVVAISVFLVALYGGYFGVGIGILMISASNLLRIGISTVWSP